MNVSLPPSSSQLNEFSRFDNFETTYVSLFPFCTPFFAAAIPHFLSFPPTVLNVCVVIKSDLLIYAANVAGKERERGNEGKERLGATSGLKFSKWENFNFIPDCKHSK